MSFLPVTSLSCLCKYYSFVVSQQMAHNMSVLPRRHSMQQAAQDRAEYSLLFLNWCS
jgi:hypothetical protein